MGVAHGLKEGEAIGEGLHLQGHGRGVEHADHTVTEVSVGGIVEGVAGDGGEEDAVINVPNAGGKDAVMEEVRVSREGAVDTVLIVGTSGDGDGGRGEGAHGDAKDLFVYVLTNQEEGLVEVKAEEVMEDNEGSRTVLVRVRRGEEGDVAAVVELVQVGGGEVVKAGVCEEEAQGGLDGRFGEVSEHVLDIEGVVGDVDGGVRGEEVLVDGSDEGAKAVSGRESPGVGRDDSEEVGKSESSHAEAMVKGMGKASAVNMAGIGDNGAGTGEGEAWVAGVGVLALENETGGARDGMLGAVREREVAGPEVGEVKGEPTIDKVGGGEGRVVAIVKGVETEGGVDGIPVGSRAGEEGAAEVTIHIGDDNVTEVAPGKAYLGEGQGVGGEGRRGVVVRISEGGRRGREGEGRREDR